MTSLEVVTIWLKKTLLVVFLLPEAVLTLLSNITFIAFVAFFSIILRFKVFLLILQQFWNKIYMCASSVKILQTVFFAIPSSRYKSITGAVCWWDWADHLRGNLARYYSCHVLPTRYRYATRECEKLVTILWMKHKSPTCPIFDKKRQRLIFKPHMYLRISLP